MNTLEQDIRLIRSHLRVVKDGPLSAKQEGALDWVETELMAPDTLPENSGAVKMHLRIARKDPLSPQREQAVDMAIEVADKIYRSAHRTR